MRQLADLVAACERAGGIEVADADTVTIDGRDYVCCRLVFSDPWAAARLLFELAQDDAADPWVRTWALSIVDHVVQAMGLPPGPQLPPEVADAIAVAIQQSVQQAIRFVHEPKETFQGARVTMALGYGDCDDHARLVYALARAAGLPATICFFEKDGQPVHVVAKIGTTEGLAWAETTLDADFGEHPLEAYDRLAGDLPPQWNPLAQPAGAGALERVSMGFLGLEFVTPQDVRDYKGELNASVTSLDADVVACVKADPAGSKIDTPTLDAWNQFVAEWRSFAADDPGLFSAGAQGRLANNYAQLILQWQDRITAAGCTLSAPKVVLPPDDPVVGTVKTVAIAAGVIAGAFALWEVSKFLPKPRRRAA